MLKLDEFPGILIKVGWLIEECSVDCFVCLSLSRISCYFIVAWSGKRALFLPRPNLQPVVVCYVVRLCGVLGAGGVDISLLNRTKYDSFSSVCCEELYQMKILME
jgi:hypothetical protein